jgi:hypothetical protein
MSDTKVEKAAVNWFEALNEQTGWSDQSKFLSWLTGVVGQQLQPSQAAQDRFADTLKRIRMHLGNIHFGLPEDLAWLNRELKVCRPGLYPLDVSTLPTGSRLPAFRIDPTCIQQNVDAGKKLKFGNHDDNTLEALRLTLVLQFAAFVGSSLDADDAEMPRVDRCRGLYRDDVALPDAAVYPPIVESQWRKEIEVLQENESSANDVLRCEYFFLKTAKARFCSDACRFSTFQIMKQLQEPGYLATKQKRYRLKTKK